jgi:hypothetical protein
MPSVRTKAAREGLATYCFSGSAAEKSYKLYSAAPRATILNDVPTFSVGDAFLDLHCLFTNNAVQKTDQRAFIVVQMISRSYMRPLKRSASRVTIALQLGLGRADHPLPIAGVDKFRPAEHQGNGPSLGVKLRPSSGDCAGGGPARFGCGFAIRCRH